MAQGLLSATTVKKEPNFLGGFDTLLRVNKDPLLPIVEDVTSLCIQMCIADAMHDSKIIENVQNLQAHSLVMLSQLSDQIQNVTDRASVENCKRICMKVIEEVERDVLAVETEVVSSTNASPKSTVLLFLGAFHRLINSVFDAIVSHHLHLADRYLVVWCDHRKHIIRRSSIQFAPAQKRGCDPEGRR